MSARPSLVDNLAVAHAAALEYLVQDLPERPMSIATGYVNLAGLHALAAAVVDGRRLRLLLGAAPDPALGADLPIDRFNRALQALATERDLARFPPSRAAAQLGRVDGWLEEDQVEVRRYLSRFLHGKAYLFGTVGDGRAALVTSANLTGAGLHHNLELGLCDYDPVHCATALEWFDDLWNQAAEFKDDLRALLFPDAGLIDPQTVYLRALLELYGEELIAELPDAHVSTVQLASFQRDGYERARRILARHGGVVYADGVGTGKTEVGLAFIEEYALRRGHHALVVAPAQLVASWRDRIDQARLPAQVVSFQQLASDEQLAPRAPNRRRHLHNARDSYRLVIVDEAHALRTSDTTWYAAMERLLGGEAKDTVLLTATPINNGLWDLYNLVMVFARHDRAFAVIGIPSVRELFVRAGANARDPEDLDPDMLFPLADAVSVRRDRSFIEERYPNAVFNDGTPVRFPTPRPQTVRYDLDTAHPGLFDEITTAIGALRMARYRPSAYLRDAHEAVAEATLGGLLQSAVLKRFESCWAACLSTVERMVAAHDLFLATWDRGAVPPGGLLRQALADVEEVGLAGRVDELLEDDQSRPISDFVPEFRDEVAADRDLLLRIRGRLGLLDPASDPKLHALLILLERSPAQKVAVFATYGDTVRYLDAHLPAPVGGRDRVAVIGGETDPDMRTGALSRFCPRTVVRDDYSPPGGEVDLLLSTDVLSEGQNLQQAAAVISYDMPWNPQRVVQRNGRVIRLKSPHPEVTLTTMLPVDGELERFLGLEATIRRKVLAAGLYGMESHVVDELAAAGELELRAFAEQLVEADPSLLGIDAAGEAAGGFSGEMLRSELLRAMAEGELERLQSLPWGTGAAFRQGPGIPSQGGPGIFFACRTRAGRRYWRLVPLGDDDSEVIGSEAEILRRIDPGPSAPGIEPPELDVESAWARAAASIVAEHNALSDPRTAEKRIGPVQRFALDLLRDPSINLPQGAVAAEQALSVERSSGVRRMLSEVATEVKDGRLGRDEAAAQVVTVVESVGLRPVEPAPALEPITVDDLGVVCWIAVLPKP